MRLVFVTSKTGHRAWAYDIRDPLGKVHFKRPGPLAPGEKLRDPGLLSGGGGVDKQCSEVDIVSSTQDSPEQVVT